MEGSNPAPSGRVGAVAANQTGAISPAPAPTEPPERLAAPRSGALSSVPASEPVDERASGFLLRASLRRRLKYLRRRRELALRDLGGFVFECHRQHDERPAMVAEKVAALSAIERECEQLEGALGERRELAVLREPGIGLCANCSTLHGSEANFCPQCGIQLDGMAGAGSTPAR